MVHVIVDELIHSALKMGDCYPHFSVIVVPLMRGISASRFLTTELKPTKTALFVETGQRLTKNEISID